MLQHWLSQVVLFVQPQLIAVPVPATEVVDSVEGSAAVSSSSIPLGTLSLSDAPTLVALAFDVTLQRNSAQTVSVTGATLQLFAASAASGEVQTLILAIYGSIVVILRTM